MASRPIDPRFSERMRELLDARRVSYRALAARIHYSASHLHAIGTGQARVTLDAARRIDAALDADGELLALVTGDAQVKDDGMQRRTLIAGLVGAGLAPEPMLAELLDRSAASTSVDDWHALIWEYGFAYPTTSRPRLLADLTRDLTTLLDVIGSTTQPARRRGLAEAVGWLAGLLAMVCTDLGRVRDARHAWLLARRHADTSGSPRVRVWVRGQEAVTGLYAGRPLSVVLALVDAGLHIDASATAGAGHLLGAQAQALALLGDASGALTALQRLRDVPTGVDGPPVFTGWREHNTRHSESFVYSAVGRVPDAYAAQDAALASYLPTRPISRAQITMHRAACMVREGDVRGGIGHAATTLAGLPQHARGMYVLTVADLVLAQVPTSQQHRSDVREYADMLTTTRAALP